MADQEMTNENTQSIHLDLDNSTLPKEFNNPNESPDISERKEYSPENDLLNLDNPPDHDDIVKQAEQLVDPIVQEAVAKQKELEISEEEDEMPSELYRKVDGSGDKKSEKSSSDDGFEHVKADDVAPINEDLSKLDETHEEFNDDQSFDPYMDKNIEDEQNIPEHEIEDYTNDETNILDNSEDLLMLDETNDNLASTSDNLEDLMVLDESHANDETQNVLSEKAEDLILNKGDYQYQTDEVYSSDRNINELDDKIINDEEIETLSSMNQIIDEHIHQDEPVQMDMTYESVPQEQILEEPTHYKDTIEHLNQEKMDEESVEKEEVIEESMYQEEMKTNESTPGSIISEKLEEENYEKSDNVINEKNLEKTEKVFPESDEEIRAKFKRILMWENSMLSGFLLGLLILFELMLMCDYSVISVLAYFGLFVLMANITCRISCRFNLMTSCPFSNSQLDLNSDDLQFLTNRFMSVLEWSINEIRSLALVQSFKKNLKAFALFYIMTYIGSWFNLLSLIFLGTLLTFTMPIFYSKYEIEIQQLMKKTKCIIQSNIEKVTSRVRGLVGY